ncbi:MAG: hemolysin III family protein [Pseudoxanthomonas suwonensis]|nr:hemolysin III family protein [Pseudoxanthomonas suwonensis]
MTSTASPVLLDPREQRADTATATAGLVLAAGGGIAMLLLVLLAQADGWQLASAIVFSASLLVMHLASTLYHREREPLRRIRLKVFDHCAIYLLIAGTYTPFTLIGLHGTLGWTLFAAIWSLAALGTIFKLFFTGRFKLASTLVYVAMGWLVMLAIKPVLAALDAWTFGWLLAGGIAYTLGTVFYMAKSMRYSHALWHLFVIAGGACHYVAVLAQVTGHAA